MSKLSQIAVCLCLALVANLIGPWHPALRGAAAPADAAPNMTAKSPFAALLSQDEPDEPNRVKTPQLVVPPELALETVMLKFLDAKSIKGVLDKVVSPYGIAAISEANNRLRREETGCRRDHRSAALDRVNVDTADALAGWSGAPVRLSAKENAC